MAAYHAARASTRPFIVTPYRAGADGLMLPDEPSTCPWAATGETCCLSVEHWRPRKTGPCHPLLVLGCGDHARAFTLYPCGHVPYGRALVAPVREDGAPHSPPDWSATIFKAALDAGHDDLWPLTSPPGDPRRRRTQRRWLGRCESVLGLRSGAPDMIASALKIATLDIRDQKRARQDIRGTAQRGALVAALLDVITVRRGVLDMVLIAGSLAGEWGPPIRWERARGSRRFLLPRNGAPP